MQEENRDETDTILGENDDIPASDTKLRRHTEEELGKKVAEKQAKMTTTMFQIKTVNTLGAIKRHLAIVVLILHSFVCLVGGAVLAIGVYLQQNWVQAGGGVCITFALFTFVIKVLMPQTSLEKMLDSPNFLEQLNNLSPQQFQKLMQKTSETNFWPRQ